MSRFFATAAAVEEPEYTGGLTVGTITTILNDTYYNAWPVICRNGSDLVLGYTKGITHHTENSGNMKVKISSNEGTTWGSELQGYFDTVTPFWSSIIGLTTLSTGRIIASVWRDQVGVSGSGEAGIVYSDDDGATWSSWIAATNGFTQEAYSAGAVIELANGDLLLPIEGSDSGDPVLNRSSHTLLSTDEGLTWGSEVTIRDYATDTRPYYETTLVLLDNTDILAIHRTAADSPGTHYISKSTDDGATWGAPVAEFAGFGKPGVIQGSSGTLIAVTRGNDPSETVAYTSLDRGDTWSSPVVLDDTPFEMEYAYPVELSEGSYLVVCGYQPTSSDSNSDIKQVLVTETMA